MEGEGTEKSNSCEDVLLEGALSSSISFSFVTVKVTNALTLSWRRLLSYKNQSIDLLRKSVDWFLYDNGLRHERVKGKVDISLTFLKGYTILEAYTTTKIYHVKWNEFIGLSIIKKNPTKKHINKHKN